MYIVSRGTVKRQSWVSVAVIWTIAIILFIVALLVINSAINYGASHPQPTPYMY